MDKNFKTHSVSGSDGVNHNSLLYGFVVIYNAGSDGVGCIGINYEAKILSLDANYINAHSQDYIEFKK